MAEIEMACEIALGCMSQDFIDGKSTLVQVMACCRQATSHYLSQCWPSSVFPYGITRPQWFKHFEIENLLFYFLFFFHIQSGFHYNVVQYDMIYIYSITVIEAEHRVKFWFTEDTLYIALMGELWGVYCEDLGENNNVIMTLYFI